MKNTLQNTVGEPAMLTAVLFLDNIRLFYDVAEVIAFGSRARGDNQPDSDLDLAIILNGGRRDFIDIKLDMANRAFDVMLEMGILVQALPLWKGDFDYPSPFPNPALIESIANEGIRLL